MEYRVKQTGELPMHTLIVGEQGVGKSTLIRRVLESLDVPICGYLTRKEDALADPELGSPIYIYEIGQPMLQTSDNLVGYCKAQRPVVYPEAFDRFADKLQKLAEKGLSAQDLNLQDSCGQSANKADGAKVPGLILLDEIGVMETRSEAFCQAILQLLDGDTPILAAVKYKDRPFLEQVRKHPKAKCFPITEDNRDDLFGEVLSYIRE